MTKHLVSARRVSRALMAGALVLGAACHHQPEPQARPTPVRARPEPERMANGAALIRAMRERYADRWYHTVTFTQKTTLALPDGGDIVQTWYEAGKLPGHLRIDTDLNTKSGVLYAPGVYAFTNGKLVRSDSTINDLLVLGFDVYTEPAERSERILEKEGIDLSRIHEREWQGRPVYVVGARAGDTTTKQFWVDRERLLFVRLLEHTSRGENDFRFEDYVPAGHAWIAARVVQLLNGKRRTLEEYSDIHTDMALSDALFDPAQWSTAPHWVKRAPND
jgi:hypothetical protein